MQEKANKAIIKEKDILLLSPTGSGKTLAFLLAVLELLNKESNQVQCLILTPSRELAIQIEQVWKKMSTGFKVSCCYGGHDMQTEIQNLVEPPALLIGTPGRIGDHFRRETLSLNSIKTLILDEFDKSLALGFEEEMRFVIDALPALSKRVLVSATAAIQVPEFTGVTHLQVLDFIDPIDAEENLSLQLVVSEDKDKVDRLVQLLSYIGAEPTLIFCNHRDAVERTSQLLQQKGIPKKILSTCNHIKQYKYNLAYNMDEYMMTLPEYIVSDNMISYDDIKPNVPYYISMNKISSSNESTELVKVEDMTEVEKSAKVIKVIPKKINSRTNIILDTNNINDTNGT
jgi:superfamily II DNA/RNA helicase